MYCIALKLDDAASRTIFFICLLLLLFFFYLKFGSFPNLVDRFFFSVKISSANLKTKILVTYFVRLCQTYTYLYHE